MTGVSADIVVGQGLVMSFGKVYEYSIECGMVSVVEKNRISPGAATTTWHYTVSQINNIILGFENDSIKFKMEHWYYKRETETFLEKNLWKKLLLI